MKSILFHPAAEAEFDNSIEFYNQRQIGLGLDFEKEVLRALCSIIDAPERSPKYKLGLRKYILRRFPFVIYYLNKSHYIWIVAIAHGARKPDYWKKRI